MKGFLVSVVVTLASAAAVNAATSVTFTGSEDGDFWYVFASITGTPDNDGLSYFSFTVSGVAAETWANQSPSVGDWGGLGKFPMLYGTYGFTTTQCTVVTPQTLQITSAMDPAQAATKYDIRHLGQQTVTFTSGSFFPPYGPTPNQFPSTFLAAKGVYNATTGIPAFTQTSSAKAWTTGGNTMYDVNPLVAPGSQIVEANVTANRQFINPSPRPSNLHTLVPVISGTGNDSDHDGVWDELQPPNQTEMLAYNGLPTGYNWRGAMEFDLSSIPAGSVITSAVLKVRYEGASGSDRDTVQFHGYVGDGTISHSDFEANNPIGALYSSFGPQDGTSFYKVSVNDFLQSLVDGGNRYAGFMVENTLWNQTSLYGLGGGPGFEPILEVTFTPEPTTLTLLALGGAAVLAQRRKHRQARNS